jgi:hypothetical protein
MSLRKIILVVENTIYNNAVTFAYPAGRGKFFTIPTYVLSVSGTTNKGSMSRKKFEVLRFGVQQKTSASTPRVVGLNIRRI